MKGLKRGMFDCRNNPGIEDFLNMNGAVSLIELCNEKKKGRNEKKGKSNQNGVLCNQKSGSGTDLHSSSCTSLTQSVYF